MLVRLTPTKSSRRPSRTQNTTATWRNNNSNWPQIFLPTLEDTATVIADGMKIRGLLRICIVHSAVTRVPPSEIQTSNSFWLVRAILVEKDHSMITRLGLQRPLTLVFRLRSPATWETWTRTVNLVQIGISNNSNVWLSFQAHTKLKTDSPTTSTARWSDLAQP